MPSFQSAGFVGGRTAPSTAGMFRDPIKEAEKTVINEYRMSSRKNTTSRFAFTSALSLDTHPLGWAFTRLDKQNNFGTNFRQASCWARRAQPLTRYRTDCNSNWNYLVENFTPFPKLTFPSCLLDRAHQSRPGGCLLLCHPLLARNSWKIIRKFFDNFFYCDKRN